MLMRLMISADLCCTVGVHFCLFCSWGCKDKGTRRQCRGRQVTVSKGQRLLLIGCASLHRTVNKMLCPWTTKSSEKWVVLMGCYRRREILHLWPWSEQECDNKPSLLRLTIPLTFSGDENEWTLSPGETFPFARSLCVKQILAYTNEGMCDKPVGPLAAVRPRQPSGRAWRVARRRDHSHSTYQAEKTSLFFFRQTQ